MMPTVLSVSIVWQIFLLILFFTLCLLHYNILAETEIVLFELTMVTLSLSLLSKFFDYKNGFFDPSAHLMSSLSFLLSIWGAAHSFTDHQVFFWISVSIAILIIYDILLVPKKE